MKINLKYLGIKISTTRLVNTSGKSKCTTAEDP